VGGGSSKLACLPLVNVKINGFGNFRKIGFHTLTALGHCKSCEGEDHISHPCTLRKTSKARVGFYTSHGTARDTELGH
jgi:hypothetical protein